MTNRSTIKDNKKERLTECYDQLDKAFGRLLDRLENYDFDEEEWEIVDGLLTTCNLRISDMEEEIRYS
jgi:hypothetical protein